MLLFIFFLIFFGILPSPAYPNVFPESTDSANSVVPIPGAVDSDTPERYTQPKIKVRQEKSLEMKSRQIEQAPEFSGFSSETVDFFIKLKKNNTREWFEAHRESYETYVLAPSRAFVSAMGNRLRTLCPKIISVPRVDKSIFRLHRDTRFSLDKSPYKTNLGIYFWEGGKSRMDGPGFYVHLEPPKFLLGAGFFMFPDRLLDYYRRAVVHPRWGGELRRIIDEISKTSDLKLGGKKYKRLPAGFDPAHRNAELLLHNGLHVSYETTIPQEFVTPGLVDYCLEKFKPAIPLHKWLVALSERGLIP
jgi:uncharacterized protein (TIGR02453 family)